MMKIMQLPVDMMTTLPGCENWIEIIYEHTRESRFQKELEKGDKNFIMVSMEFTEHQGKGFKASDGRNDVIPNSQHSNCCELEKFVKR